MDVADALIPMSAEIKRSSIIALCKDATYYL